MTEHIRQANGSKFKPLTSMQIVVLKSHADKPERAIMGCPHAIYRSLVIRGYLRPCRHGGYELTPDGHRRIEGLRWSLT